MAASVRVALAGALGRMGQAVAKAADGRRGLEIAARFDRPGMDGEGLVSLEEALGACDVVIDFTTAAASAELASRCAERGGPALVIGSTGYSADELARVEAAAKKIAIVRSGNFSLGVNVLQGLVGQAARLLGPEDWDIEVFEAHHSRKVDAPSGTALMLGGAAAKARGVVLKDVMEAAREGQTGPRREGAIGFAVMRGGDIIGEHSVTFAAKEEIVTLSHSARDRGLFAQGALRAAQWVAGQPAGLYDMQDVLGFTDA
ncbi:MAG TPA: 4-hydroxy-tetrahydrodipicolinate reductase [Caulobacteraceae bacterium]